MNARRNGECAAIRTYLREHDAATIVAIASALKQPVPAVAKACQRMAADGRLEREPHPAGYRGASVYRLGRLPDLERRPPRGQVLQIKASIPARAPGPSIPAQSVEEYLARGGTVERLPAYEVPHNRYPPNGALAY